MERGLRALPGNVMINDAVDVLMVKRSRLAEKKKTRLAKLKKERQMEKSREINQVLDIFIQVCTDILRDFVNTYQRMICKFLRSCFFHFIVKNGL